MGERRVIVPSRCSRKRETLCQTSWKMSGVTGLFSVTRVLWDTQTHTHTHDNSRKRITMNKSRSAGKSSQENELLRVLGVPAVAAHRRLSELRAGGLLQKA